jgi:hypothetical protein
MVPVRFAALIALAFCVCVLGTRGASASEYNRLSLSGEAIDGFDVVAYWTTGQPTQGTRAYSYEWHDAVWLFASADDLAKFQANPTHYAPAFGGYCAYAMSKGIKAEIHPFIFKIEDDKLYLFYSFESRDKFLADPSLEQAAEDQWSTIGQRLY